METMQLINNNLTSSDINYEILKKYYNSILYKFKYCIKNMQHGNYLLTWSGLSRLTLIPSLTMWWLHYTVDFIM